jgi:hypothetical protein
VWAIGGERDAAGVWHPLAEHWNGSAWSVSQLPTGPGGGASTPASELLYAVSASSAGDVDAVGQTGTAFPSSAFVEHWGGSGWTRSEGPADATESLVPLAVDAAPGRLTLVGERESDAAPNTTLVAAGAPSAPGLLPTPSAGTGENDLFSVATATDGSTWAAGWYIVPSTGNHEPLLEHRVGGAWTLAPSPDLSADGGDNGFAGLAAVPGGGLWAVGTRTNNAGNPATLIEHHP